jgi:hypothetical protein
MGYRRRGLFFWGFVRKIQSDKVDTAPSASGKPREEPDWQVVPQIHRVREDGSCDAEGHKGRHSRRETFVGENRG